MIWQKLKIGSDKSQAFIVGRNSEHCAVVWLKPHVEVCPLDIIRLEDGLVLKTLLVKPKFALNYLSVQMNNGRLAFQGVLATGDDYDITVFDMNTWDVVVRCDKDLGIDNSKSFLLNKNGLILLHRNQLVSARFWL